MANRKISDLTALTAPATGDLLPIVDISEAAAADKNKKITYGELLASAPAGSAAAPSFSFDGDPNTGIYSPGADQVAISTNATQRLVIDASGNINIDSNGIYYDKTNKRLGIGSPAPQKALDVIGQIQARPVGNTTGNSDWFVIGSVQPASDFGVGIGLSVENSSTNAYGLTLGTKPNSGTGITERLRIDSSGRLLVGTSADSGGALLQVNGDRIRVGTAKTPATSGATGTTGEIAWDANYIYVCTATNTWKRSAIATW